MSTYVLMRILESAPRRYDLGIRLLTLGRLDKAYGRLAGHIKRDQEVLDIGCGTGALMLHAARRGAKVKGIDTSAQMIETARQRMRASGFTASAELVEMGVAELDAEKARRYDAVTSGLCLSELSEDEVAYTLKQVARILRPGGLFLVADEMRPHRLAARSIHLLIRIPLAALAYVLTQQTTHPISNLVKKIQAAGFVIVSARFNRLGSFGELVAQKPADAAS